MHTGRDCVNTVEPRMTKTMTTVTLVFESFVQKISKRQVTVSNGLQRKDPETRRGSYSQVVSRATGGNCPGLPHNLFRRVLAADRALPADYALHEKRTHSAQVRSVLS